MALEIHWRAKRPPWRYPEVQGSLGCIYLLLRSHCPGKQRMIALISLRSPQEARFDYLTVMIFLTEVAGAILVFPACVAVIIDDPRFFM